MKENHTNKKFFMQLFTVALTFIVLFSSCSTKRGFKTLFNIPVNTTQTVKLTGEANFISTQKTCLSCKDLQVITSDNDFSVQKNLTAVALLTVVYKLFIDYVDLFDKPTPIANTLDSLSEIPKYILFKKLILHNA